MILFAHVGMWVLYLVRQEESLLLWNVTLLMKLI